MNFVQTILKLLINLDAVEYTQCLSLTSRKLFEPQGFVIIADLPERYALQLRG